MESLCKQYIFYQVTKIRFIRSGAPNKLVYIAELFRCILKLRARL